MTLVNALEPSELTNGNDSIIECPYNYNNELDGITLKELQESLLMVDESVIERLVDGGAVREEQQYF